MPARPALRPCRGWRPCGLSRLRHCEEQSDEAIHGPYYRTVDCFASLAMTISRSVYCWLRPRRRRQEMNIVFRGHRDDVLGLLLLHVVKAPEQIVQLLGGRYPEQHFCGLVGFVEDAMGKAHPEAYQVARRRLGIGAGKHEIEFAFQHVEIFVLVGVDMRRHEGPGRQRRMPGEAMV